MMPYIMFLGAYTSFKRPMVDINQDTAINVTGNRHSLNSSTTRRILKRLCDPDTINTPFVAVYCNTYLLF